MPTRDGWDAASYDRVSNIQRSWGIKLLEMKAWKGSEIVLDAGAGPGSLTKVIAARTPKGRVYAVEQDAEMISLARQNLADVDNAIVIQSDMSAVQLPEKVDVIFSNAAIHWVLDHRRLFSHFRRLLRDGGELLIQCGGKGNLQRTISIIEKIKNNPDRFAMYFSDWKPTWRFASADETMDLLQSLGYRDVHTSITSQSIQFDERTEFSKFARTVILRPFLQHLSDNLTCDEFSKDFEDSVEALGDRVLDYTRLTITAKK